MNIKEEAKQLANSMEHCECGLCIDSNKEKIETSLQGAFRAGMLKAAEFLNDCDHSYLASMVREIAEREGA